MSNSLKPITQLATELGLQPGQWIPYGFDKAKLRLELIKPAEERKGKLILVTAITPNKAGVGKTTTSIALAQGLQHLGKRAMPALREPSLGPCFGMKGGATGGGKAQIHPSDDINLHFTGDFHAITTAHNMLSALLDNYRYFNRSGDQALKSVVWKRVLDINDRSLRYIITGLNGSANGIPTESGFDITPASELMAILCLSEDRPDLENRINRIVLGTTMAGKSFTVKDLGVAPALVALLKDALLPNLVQTTEGGPALIHGGPFANIAHGCNSVIATKMALSLSDYVVTEAGFGADLGGEKFMNIKCRIAGLMPAATVIVVGSQSLKLHGGVPEAEIQKPHAEGLQHGLANLQRHIENIQAFGQPVVVAFNRFPFDSASEIEQVKAWCEKMRATFALNDGFSSGGAGAADLAQKVLDAVEKNPAKDIKHSYSLSDSLEIKIEKVVKQVYRGAGIQLSKKAEAALRKLNTDGHQGLPVCMAKTQYSFSDDPAATGVSTGFTLHIEDLVLNAGAGFIVAIAGEMMRMPGLPKLPQALSIRVGEDGQVEGLG
jgi:formate--tetrahydrofolate ligase